MAPKDKAQQLFESGIELFDKPIDLFILAELKSINLDVCTIMQGLECPIYWEETKNYIQKHY